MTGQNNMEMLEKGAEILTLEVMDAQAGDRLDKTASGLSGLSRSRIRQLIDEGRVHVDGESVHDPALKIRCGQQIRIDVPPLKPAQPAAQAIPLSIVFEDPHLIVIDKPAGLVVHPAAGNPDGTLVNALLAHCKSELSGIGGVERPGIVHRIDKETSGLLVVAKTDAAHQGLSEQFADHSIERAYWAFVRGVPNPPGGRIDRPIGRSSTNRKKMAIVTRGGKPAVTTYKVKQRFGEASAPLASLVECRLETGRTHQIRVHLTGQGHPLLGDPLYGRGAQRLPGPGGAKVRDFLASWQRQALHARLLGFIHPVTGEMLRFESPMPEDLNGLLTVLKAL